MESDPTRMCALLVGLPDVTVVGVGDWPGWLRVVITTDLDRRACCGRGVWRHGVREVVLVDLPAFGRPVEGVVQAAVAMPDVSSFVDPTAAGDRVVAVSVDDEGGSLGDGAGRPAWPFGCRGCCGSGLRLAHGDGRRDALRDSVGR